MFPTNIPENFVLITNTQEIKHILESVGIVYDSTIHGSLFIEPLDCDYGSIYSHESIIPYNNLQYDKIR